MVLFYSASGNTRYIAKQLANNIDDECLDLLQRIRTNDFSEIRSERPFVICSPIHVSNIPLFLTEYFKRVKLVGSRQIYFVVTSGGYAGPVDYFISKLTKVISMDYMGHAEFIMPSNHVISNSYPATDPDDCRKRISESDKKISAVAETIKNGRKLNSPAVKLWEKMLVPPIVYSWNKFGTSAKGFHTSDKCVSCGKCSKVCPLNNIRTENKHPVWGKNCAHCMACISNCPADAVEYAKTTQGKERYNIKKYVNKELL